MKVMPIIGVRPQIIKSAPVLRLLSRDSEVDVQLIHSGQHYDFEMSRVFFNELNLPEPLHNLNVGSGSHATQTARLMIRVEKTIKELKPDVVVVFGDANTTLAGALAAIKVPVPVCHVEAGLRSHDLRMPEEVNRVLTDHCSRMLCAPTSESVKNLEREGLEQEFILLSGDTMYDAVLQHRGDVERSTVIEDLELTKKVYATLTVHRPENVDNPRRLAWIVSAVTSLKEITIVFPLHPRARKRLMDSNLLSIVKRASNIILTKPLGYYDMLNLMKNSAVVLTDSGGMQKEAFLLRVPCITMRDNTEWVETVSLGANRLVGADTERILRETRKVLAEGKVRERFASLPNPFGDGKASEKIVEDMKDRFHSGRLALRPVG